MEDFNPFSLVGKTILVTGASSGIGRAIAIECAKMGAQMIITGRNAERLNQTFEELVGEGHQQLIADLSNTESLGEVVNQLPALNGLVHCAGIAAPLPFKFIKESDLKSIFDVNFNSTVLLTQKLLKTKKLAKSSSIVFISSVSGVHCGYAGGSLYSATKGAINGLIKSMAIDLAAQDIRVNSVCPAMIETAILESGVITPEQLEEDRRRYPLKRYGKPEEVAFAVIYLLSDASAWVTGSNLLIDGGYTLQ